MKFHNVWKYVRWTVSSLIRTLLRLKCSCTKSTLLLETSEVLREARCWQNRGSYSEVPLPGSKLLGDRVASRSKNCRTDADHGRAFFDGDIQILGHAHRDRVKIIA